MAAEADSKRPDAGSLSARTTNGASRKKRWQRMMQTKGGIGSFIRDDPEAFRRRVRRGVPTEHRWEVWKAMVGTEKRREPGLFQALLGRESTWTRNIEIDIPRTFPEMPFFDKEQQQSLLRVLHAYANFDMDVGYCQGMNFVAGFLLLVAQNGDFRETPRLEKEEETFWTFVCIMEGGGLNGFYKKQLLLLRRYLWAFDEIVGVTLPKLQEHFIRENVQHAVYLHQWFLTLFINCLPLPMVLLFWDVIICDGLNVLLAITVSLLKELEGLLLGLQFEDIVRFFKMMRADDDADSTAIARMVVARSSCIELPAHVTERLQDPDCTSDEGDGELDPEDGGFVALGTGPSSSVAPRSASASSSALGDYFRSVGDKVGELPQGMRNWWEDAVDNLQRVGLSVPARGGVVATPPP